MACLVRQAMKNNELTAHPVAKQLKKFFRKHRIKYCTVYRNITIDWQPATPFPPLTFYFSKSSGLIKVFNKKDYTGLHWFFAATITQLLSELHTNNIIETKHLFQS